MSYTGTCRQGIRTHVPDVTLILCIFSTEPRLERHVEIDLRFTIIITEDGRDEILVRGAWKERNAGKPHTFSSD